MTTGAHAEYLAHSANGIGKTESVMDHLHRVAELAQTFAAVWGSAWEGQVAGMLHDLGKYGDLFQGVIRGSEQKIDHTTPGAHAVLRRYRRVGTAVALAIQGHHGGLRTANWADFTRSLRMDSPADGDGRRYSCVDVSTLLDRYQADDGHWPEAGESRFEKHVDGGIADAAMLDARMLLSALVDADYLATAAHFEEGADGYKVRRLGPVLQPAQALAQLTRRTALAEQEARKRGTPSHVIALRNDLWRACLQAADWPQGVFTLTAPTGAGKTLAMMAFALKHAEQHGLRRVIVVLPYLSIIDQSARVYEQAFAAMRAGYVLQDHSLAREPGELDDNLRRVAQNWDAPVIVTTTVRFFESLFANRPTDGRKLHNIASSIVMFDEAQTMPVELAVPTLAALSHLQSNYGVSVLFSTATQPALARVFKRAEQQQQRSVQGWRPREIVGPELKLYERARRVVIQWPRGVSHWDAVAEETIGQRQVLVIVNLRRHAFELFKAVRDAAPDGTYHLSTTMCPAHRLTVLNEVQARLHGGLPCRLISTQCVEAGVDLDFPQVWRALGPLDAVAQAAGRCNREGKHALGRVRVFRPPDEAVLYPSTDYAHATLTLQEMLLARGEVDILDPATVETYFDKYYLLDRPERRIKPELDEAIRALNFEQAARAYQWIAGRGCDVIVPYAPERARFDRLAAEARRGQLHATWFRDARAVAVGVRGWVRRGLLDLSEEVKTSEGDSTGWYILLEAAAYDAATGLNAVEGPQDASYLA